jgi:hypothetical protein
MSGGSFGSPTRPDAPAGMVRSGRRWLPVWIVGGVIVVTVLGGFVTAAALPAPQVRSLNVGGHVTVRPLAGWAIVRRGRAVLPGPSGGTVAADFAQLSRGSGALDVLAIDGFGGDADAAAAFYAEEVLARQLERPTVSVLDHVVLRNGLVAARFGYIGTEPEAGAAIEGSVTVAVGSSGTVAVFDGWGSEGQLELIEEELQRMVDTAEVA